MKKKHLTFLSTSMVYFRSFKRWFWEIEIRKNIKHFFPDIHYIHFRIWKKNINHFFVSHTYFFRFLKIKKHQSHCIAYFHSFFKKWFWKIKIKNIKHFSSMHYILSKIWKKILNIFCLTCIIYFLSTKEWLISFCISYFLFSKKWFWRNKKY